MIWAVIYGITLQLTAEEEEMLNRGAFEKTECSHPCSDGAYHAFRFISGGFCR